MKAAIAGGAGILGGIVGGLVAGAIGAGIWAAISYYGNVEIGWIAWGIGGLTGFGVLLGCGRAGGFLTGMIAVLISVASICGGKYAAVHFAIADAEATVTKQMEDEIAKTHTDDDSFLLVVADEVATEWMESGKSIAWPNNKELEDRDSEEDYPANLLKEARSRWTAMNADERESFKQAVETEMRAGLAAAFSQARGEYADKGFADSWGILDIVFVLLAVGTAFKLGSASTTE